MNLNITENYVVPSKFGGYRVVETEDEATALVVSKDALIKIANRIKDLESRNEELESINASKDNEIIILTREKFARNKNDNEFKTEIGSLKAQLFMIESKNEELKSQNESLIRVNRQRANKERKLRPRKSHSGYFLVYSNPVERIFKIHGSNKRIQIFETVFMTPYVVTIPFKEADSLIEKDLNKRGDDNQTILKALGCELYYPECDYTKIIDDKIPEIQKEYYEQLVKEYKDKGDGWCGYTKQDEFRKESHEYNPNIFFNKKLRMNGKQGYWELVLHHLKPCYINELFIQKQ